MNNPLPWLALALMVFAVPAHARQPDSTRADEARRAREQRAAQPPATTTGRVERFLDWIERGPLSGAHEGFGVHVGIENGPGLAFGPAWRTSGAFGRPLHLSVAAAASPAGDRQVAAAIGLPRLAAGRLALGLQADTTHLAQERFYGPGMASLATDATVFASTQRQMAAVAAFTAPRWLRISFRAGALTARASDAPGRGIPSIGTRFAAADAAGLGVDLRYRVLSLGAAVDSRDVPQNPRSGGHYSIAAHRYAASPHSPYSFTRVDAEAEQHVPFWKRQRVITLRAIASTALTAGTHDVPFALQPTLGGSRVLRGFVADRFRGRSLLALQAEYGWDVSPFLNAVLFYETGAVGPSLRRISTGALRSDYGIGFRFGSSRTVAFRTDVAFGSGEGTRVTMRFNHAF